MTTNSQHEAGVVRPSGCTCGAASLPQPTAAKNDSALTDAYRRGLHELLDALDHLRADFERRLTGLAATPSHIPAPAPAPAPAPESEAPVDGPAELGDLLQPFTDLRPLGLQAPRDRKKRFSVQRLDLPLASLGPLTDPFRDEDPT
ncbi:hypothetical protein [Streptomyces sp. Da 82-17]|uniref:hypothetical protein n=1 Tax=Streptomyces sp. Da 82-17 TaxID=3377116 RepID=UPI0038D440E3